MGTNRGQQLRRNLFAGIAVVLPLAFIALVVYGIVLFGVRMVLRVHTALHTLGFQGPIAVIGAVSIALVGLPLILIVLGMVVRNRFGTKLVDLVDACCLRLPGLGPIYASLRHSREALTGEDVDAFNRVVSVELTPGVDTLGFVVGQKTGGDWTVEDRDRITVWLPLSPNPTVGGHLVAVEADRLTETEMGVNDALAALLTVGAGDLETVDPPISGLFKTVQSPSDTRGRNADEDLTT